MVGSNMGQRMEYRTPDHHDMPHCLGYDVLSESMALHHLRKTERRIASFPPSSIGPAVHESSVRKAVEDPLRWRRLAEPSSSLSMPRASDGAVSRG